MARARSSRSLGLPKEVVGRPLSSQPSARRGAAAKRVCRGRIGARCRHPTGQQPRPFWRSGLTHSARLSAGHRRRARSADGCAGRSSVWAATDERTSRRRAGRRLPYRWRSAPQIEAAPPLAHRCRPSCWAISRSSSSCSAGQAVAAFAAALGAVRGGVPSRSYRRWRIRLLASRLARAPRRLRSDASHVAVRRCSSQCCAQRWNALLQSPLRSRHGPRLRRRASSRRSPTRHSYPSFSPRRTASSSVYLWRTRAR